MMKQTSLGDQELALLRFVADHGPTTTGEAATHFGEPNGLARSTIETVLSRLHKKGFLLKVADSGLIRYQVAMEPQEVVGGLVDQFVQRTLGGSLVPLVSHFVRQSNLTAEETAELERLVAKLDAGRREEK